MAAGQKSLVGPQEPGEAHYFKKQKDCHIIEVKSRNTQNQNVTVHAVEPNFGGLNKTIGQTDEVFYQLKSFSYRNLFLNVKPTDQLIIFIDLEIQDLYQFIEAPNAVNQQPPIAPIQIQGTTRITPFRDAGCFVVEELVDKINVAIDTQMFEMIQEEMVGQPVRAQLDLSALPQDQQAFVILFDSYKYEILEGRMQLVKRPKELIPNLLQTYQQLPAQLIGRNQLIISAITASLYPAEDLEQKDQRRLARIYGMINNDQPFKTILSIAQISRLQYHYNDLFKQNLGYDPFDVLLAPQDLADGIICIGPPIIANRNCITLSTYPVALPLDYLYIHSSLNNNNYDQDGRKRDVLARIPIKANTFMGALVTFEPISTAGREYDTKASLGSAKNFTISLKDENDEDIEFLDDEPYQMEIAVFFQPKQAIEYMV